MSSCSHDFILLTSSNISCSTGIHIREWPVYGIYQPDGIQWFRWNDESYVITANEGKSVSLDDDPVNFDEDIRGANIEGACFLLVCRAVSLSPPLLRKE